MLRRALIGTGTALVAAGLLSACAGEEDHWDLPLSPMSRPRDIPLQDKDVCAVLHADRIAYGCRLPAENGTAEVVFIPRSATPMRRYADAVDGESVRWVGISRFPAIQLADTSGTDGMASCRIAVDVADDQVLLVLYRRQAADPKLAPCRPARDHAAKAVGALQTAAA